MSKLHAALDTAARETRNALLLAIDEQPVDAETVKKLAAIHGQLLAMRTAAAPQPAKK